MQLLLCGLITAISLQAIIGAETTDIPVETVSVSEGDPFILSFGYSGPVLDISVDVTKDGKIFVADNTRIFKQLDRLLFSEVLEQDSGEYHISINGNGVHFTKTIKLSG